MNDFDFLRVAIKKSQESVDQGGFPVGALVVINNEIIAEGVSNGKQLHDATAHAEVCAIREASKKLGKRNLKNAVIYSSLEPCLMCFSASYWAYVTKIVYACSKSKVSMHHYEGLHNLQELNAKNNHQMEIMHIKELEESALKVINDWETSLKLLKNDSSHRVII